MMLFEAPLPALGIVRRPWRLLIVLVVLAPLAIVGGLAYRQYAVAGDITVTSGTPGGIYSRLGEELTGLLNQKLGGCRAKNMMSAGSDQNVERVSRGEADLGFAQDGLPAGSNVRALAQLYSSPLQIVVPRDKNLRGVKDLVSRRVFLGERNSGTRTMATFVLGRYGLNADRDVQVVENVGGLFGGAKALLDGRADAAFFLVGLDSPAVQELANSGKFDLVDIDRAKGIAGALPVVDVVEIASGSYATSTEFPSTPVRTIASREILICSARMTDLTAYRIVELLFQNAGPLVRRFPLLTQLSRIESSRNFYYPIHEGALAYYKREERPPFVNRTNLFGAIGSSISAGAVLMVLFRRRWAGIWLRRLHELDERIAESSADPAMLDQITELELQAFAAYRRGVIGKENYELVKEYGRICREKLGGSAAKRKPATGSAA